MAKENNKIKKSNKTQVNTNKDKGHALLHCSIQALHWGHGAADCRTIAKTGWTAVNL